MIPLVLVGLGRIAIGNQGLAGDTPLSHLAAARSVGCFRLTGLIDTDAAARAAAVNIDDPALIAADLDAIPRQEGEVIAICASSSAHAALTVQAFQRKPRVVLVEKPLATTLEEAMRVEAIEPGPTVLRVNFHRRLDPRHRRWRERRPLQPHTIEMRYGKGLLNYASHLIDFLLDWYGPIVEVQAIIPLVPDCPDPSISFRCRMEAGFEVIVLGLPGLAYDQFEIDILARDQRLLLAAGGADIRRFLPKVNLHYADYSHLAEEEEERDIGPVGGFAELYRAVRDYCRKGTPLPGCTGAEALANMAVIEAVRDSVRGNGMVVALQNFRRT